MNLHNSVLRALSAPNWSESSTYWQFLYHRLPSKFWYTAGEIAKMWCQELDIYRDITLSIIDNNFLYQFSQRFHHFSVSFQCQKIDFKIIKSWQVCDCLAKWLIMLELIDLWRPRVSRRSNVGLVCVSFSEFHDFFLEIIGHKTSITLARFLSVTFIPQMHNNVFTTYVPNFIDYHPTVWWAEWLLEVEKGG